VTETLLVSPDQPGAYGSIGDALGAAPAGSVVSVDPGTYYEALFVNDREITVVAAQGPGTVTIDASAATYPTVSCNRGRLELRDLTLKAAGGPGVRADDRATLTMTGCTLSAGTNYAITVSNRSEFTLTGCTVTGGRGGLVVEESAGTVDGCGFAEFSEDGIVVRAGSNPAIRASTITRCGNHGIAVDGATPTIEDCEISQLNGVGVAVTNQSAPVLRRCRVHATRGPAVSLGPGCRGTVEECTTENTATPAIAVAAGAEVVGRRSGRPPVVVAAVLLMIPAALTWLVAGIGWLVVTSRLEGDALFLFWILAVFILALCLLLVAMTISGMRHAWRGWSNLLRIPAGVTAALFALALIGLIVRRSISYEPTMVTPLVVGGLAGVAMVLLTSAPAKKWFAGGFERRAAELHQKRAGRAAENAPRG
jgi:hypothetical protein